MEKSLNELIGERNELQRRIDALKPTQDAIDRLTENIKQKRVTFINLLDAARQIKPRQREPNSATAEVFNTIYLTEAIYEAFKDEPKELLHFVSHRIGNETREGNLTDKFFSSVRRN